MLDFALAHWGQIMFGLIVFSLLAGMLIGVSFGCRVKRRRRIGFGKDSAPMNHFAKRGEPI